MPAARGGRKFRKITHAKVSDKMIYTVTFNPALDYILRVGQLCPGKLHRAESDVFAVGGKGINVSRVLKNLGVHSVATGFIAGEVGDVICRMLDGQGVAHDFIRVGGQSRVNVKIKGREETEINGRGPDIPPAALAALAQKLAAAPAGSILVLAGSVPASLPQTAYEQLLTAIGRKDLRIVADASGALLLGALPFRPWLIKPNRDELDETFGLHMRSVDEALAYAQKLRAMGARNVIVSMGGGGALMAAESGTYYQSVFQGEVVDTVGAGDSLVAGFIAAKEAGEGDREALRYAVAAGCASSFREGLAEQADIRALLSRGR